MKILFSTGRAASELENRKSVSRGTKDKLAATFRGQTKRHYNRIRDNMHLSVRGKL